MANNTSASGQKKSNSIPRRAVFTVIGFLCFGLLASALFTFTTLSRLRTDYLSSRGHEIVYALDAQARGPERRHNPVLWQSIFEANYETYSASVSFFALIDQNGNVLASIGSLPAGPADKSGLIRNDLYIFEELLPRPRNPRGDIIHAAAGWRIRVGLKTEDSNFIKRMSFLQLIISGLAIAALIVLSLYLMRMLNHFFALKARETAEAQLKSLGVMAASLAHEIRNPLGAMKGLTQLAQEEISADHPAQAQLHTVVNEAERLEKLVTDLLDFARKKEPQIREFNLAELLADTAKMLQPKLEASKTALQISVNPNPFYLRSDPDGLRQVLLNVLINAMDASPARGEVRIKAKSGNDGKTLLIQIDDSGAGLGPNASDELFQPFITTKARGTGLGLAISRQIIEGLGGSLSLENLPQGGARCTVALPLN